VAGAAADARKTRVDTRHAARTRELPAGTAADTRHASLPARTATRSIELSAGAAVATGVTAATARILLVDNVSGCGTRGAADISLSCRNGHHSDRCSNSPTNKQRFHESEFL
jgi:hypothetical protein